MIEVVAVPVLLKAIDFLFGEGSKILQERRARRKAEQDAGGSSCGDSTTEVASEAKSADTTQSAEDTTAQAPDKAEKPNVIQSKEAALEAPVDGNIWKDSEMAIKHLISLLEVYTKNYHLATEQYAKFGSALVPPIIVHNLTEAEDGIAATTEKLQSALSKVYGKAIVVPDRREQ